MSLNDPLGNVLSHIHNSEKASKKECTLPSSKLIIKVLNIMKDNHYIGDFEKLLDGKSGLLTIRLLGSINKCSVIKPRYPFKKTAMEKFEKRYLPSKGFGIIIVSTSKGVMTLENAKALNLGGRLLSFVY